VLVPLLTGGGAKSVAYAWRLGYTGGQITKWDTDESKKKKRINRTLVHRRRQVYGNETRTRGESMRNSKSDLFHLKIDSIPANYSQAYKLRQLLLPEVSLDRISIACPAGYLRFCLKHDWI